MRISRQSIGRRALGVLGFQVHVAHGQCPASILGTVHAGQLVVEGKKSYHIYVLIWCTLDLHRLFLQVLV